MESFVLLEIYEDNRSELTYYVEQMDRFLRLWHSSKIDEKRKRIGNKDEYYFKWILNEIPSISDNDEWLISREGLRQGYYNKYWAKMKGIDRLGCIKDLWYMEKMGTIQRKYGYAVGFLAINKTIGLIIDVGVYSDDEYHYTLSTLKI